MRELIAPEDLPNWVPGELTMDSAALGWTGMRIRGYRYSALDVPVPAMQDYMIVVYQQGATPMNRRCIGDWRNEHVAPGSVSLLTHAAQSHWRWSEDIEVSHIYLSPKAVAAVASDVFERDVKDVELFDVLKAIDPVLGTIAGCLASETLQEGIGGSLYTEALKNQACVHLLRRYSNVVFHESRAVGAFTSTQRRLLMQHIEDNLALNITLADLAGVVGLSVFHFTRRFRAEFGCPPHTYIIRRRIEFARRQLAHRDIPLKVVAADSGFADQSHMTRLFRRLLNTTPADYRRVVLK